MTGMRTRASYGLEIMRTFNGAWYYDSIFSEINFFPRGRAKRPIRTITIDERHHRSVTGGPTDDEHDWAVATYVAARETMKMLKELD